MLCKKHRWLHGIATKRPDPTSMVFHLLWHSIVIIQQVVNGCFYWVRWFWTRLVTAGSRGVGGRMLQASKRGEKGELEEAELLRCR